MRMIRSLPLAATSALVLALTALPLIAVQSASALTDVSPRADECTITGTAGADVLRGTAGSDVICGLGGDDVIYGLRGDDVLVGGPGRDELRGGAGNDRLVGGPGRDVLVDTTLSVSADGDYPVKASVREVGEDVLPLHYANAQASCAEDVAVPPDGGTAKPIQLFVAPGKTNPACGGMSVVTYDVSQKVSRGAPNKGTMTVQLVRRPGSQQVDSITAKCRGDFECFLTAIDGQMAIMIRAQP